MLETRLVLLEGLPGSGKSTQAQWLEVILKHQHIPARWYSEGDVNHPLNWFDDWWQPEFDMLPYFADLPAAMQRCLANWKIFVQATLDADTLPILENWPFLNSLFMFIYGNADLASLRVFARQTQQIIAPLNPTLIYFHQSAARQALQRILAIRGPGFERELFHNMSRFPFCQQRGLVDFECVTAIWEANQILMRELLPGYAPHQLELDVTPEVWSDYRQQMLDLLQVNEAPLTTTLALEPLVGDYRGERQLEIRLENEALIAIEAGNVTPLLRLKEHTFYWQGRPITLTFAADGTRLTIDSSRMFGPVQTLTRVSQG